MTNEMGRWHCDVCGEMIDGAENGYVIWKNDANMKSCGFKIVHHMKCDLPDHTSSSALEDFVGPAGLAKLLSHLSLGPIKQRMGQQSWVDVADLDEFVDLIRRVQTPFYEHARQKFSSSELLSDFSDANEVYPYQPDVLQRIAAKY